MATKSKPRGSTKPRTPLSRARILHTAIALADERGLSELTMRKLGQQLGVEAYDAAREPGTAALIFCSAAASSAWTAGESTLLPAGSETTGTSGAESPPLP